MKGWDTLYRRIERAAERLPAPATALPFDMNVFTAAEVAMMTAIAGHYPAGTFGRGGDLSILSEDDLEALAGIAARVKARRDGQEAPIETA